MHPPVVGQFPRSPFLRNLETQLLKVSLIGETWKLWVPRSQSEKDEIDRKFDTQILSFATFSFAQQGNVSTVVGPCKLTFRTMCSLMDVAVRKYTMGGSLQQ
ncbi:MAG: hypothetical protein JWN92_1243 [Candidatus Acidoferrum typicum]|nr:hypothetical protein [Candidatus Acidoferrum typicum]